MKYIIREDPEFGERNLIVKIEDNGEEEIIGADGGEPEDNYFSRDYYWVIKELNKLAEEINSLREKDK